MVMRMRVFIDLVYFVNVILGTLCILSLSILTGRIVRYPKLILLSLLWGFSIITLYTTEIFYYVFVVLISVLFERKHWIKNSFIFLFIHETYMNCLSGVNRIGHVLIITEKFDWFLPLLFGIVIVFIYLGSWFQFRKEALHQNLIYDIQIKLSHTIISCKGFLDTGNQALYQGIPIIFLKKQLKDMSIPLSLGGKKYFGQKGEVYFNQQWIKVLIVGMESLDVEADCLLNYYLM